MTPNGVVAALVIALMVGVMATLCAVVVSNHRERNRARQARDTEPDPDDEAAAQRQRSGDLARALADFNAAKLRADQRLVADLNEAIERDQALGGQS